MTIKKAVFSAALLLTASLAGRVNAATVVLDFVGSGVSGTIQLTYGPSTDAKYPQAFEVTGISGTFTDMNNGLNIVNAPVGPLEPVHHDRPELTNLLAPNDFSRFAVASGLDPISNGFLTYSNLYYPGGSPQTASDYPLHGGVLDIYGLMFDIGGGRVVDFWSNGTPQGTGSGPIYGVAVATSAQALDYVGGVTVSPEPNTIALLGGGLLAFVVSRRVRKA
jgi:hypothetical protein